MKRIFGFLLTLGLVFSLAGDAFGQVCSRNDGQVRYGFELKTLTAQEAQAAQQQGYVDLWAYACFDQSYVDKGWITLDAQGKITRWALLAGDATHSYKIIDKNGNDDKSGSVAMFAAPNSSYCGGRAPVYQNAAGGATPKTFIQSCPTWAYGSSSSRSSLLDLQVLCDLYCTTIQAEGKTWYCLKLYSVRFEYKQAKSFYVTFYRGSAADGVTSNGASNFNFYTENTETQLIWPGKNCGSGQDWSESPYWGTIPGGVEVISDPEMLLTAEATCGGTDATGKLTVNDWAGKTWANYSGVKFFVNKTGGTVRKPLTASDIATTPSPIPTSGTAAEIAYTLTPSGYTLSDGSYADSLIWVIEDTFLA